MPPTAPRLKSTPARRLSLAQAMALPVPPGRLRETVTDMESLSPPGTPPPPLPSGVRLLRYAGELTWAEFGPLFHAVGDPWLWRDRLLRSAEEEAAHLADPGVVIHVLERTGGAALGFCEMEARDPRAGFRVLYFGLVADAIGGGLGRLLFAHALDDAWAQAPATIRLDTCTHDHPGAVAFYQGFGFSVTGRRVVDADDPRLTGLLPSTAAPHIPLAPMRERPPTLRTA